jgi:hypothetical protein
MVDRRMINRTRSADTWPEKLPDSYSMDALLVAKQTAHPAYTSIISKGAAGVNTLFNYCRFVPGW